MLRPSWAVLSVAAATFIGAITFSYANGGSTAYAVREVPQSAQPAVARAYTGPGSCAAAACHGAIRPVPGSRILQTEYTTWIAQDRHARAAQVLSSPVSVRMAKILGLPAAHNAPKCLACHALDAPEAQQARTTGACAIAGPPSPRLRRPSGAAWIDGTAATNATVSATIKLIAANVNKASGTRGMRNALYSMQMIGWRSA